MIAETVLTADPLDAGVQFVAVCGWSVCAWIRSLVARQELRKLFADEAQIKLLDVGCQSEGRR